MAFQPVTEMDKDELAAELEQLIGSLPALRHLPTLTLDRAVALTQQTANGATPEDATWLIKLIGYSVDHATRFEEASRRIIELRACLPAEPEAPQSASQAHPVLSNDLARALQATQKAFRHACECFVESRDSADDTELKQLDTAAVNAAKNLAKTLPVQ